MGENAGDGRGTTAQPNESRNKSGASRKRVKRILVAVIFCLVVFGIARAVRNASVQFGQQQRELQRELQVQVELVERLITEENDGPSGEKSRDPKRQTEKRKAEEHLSELRSQQFRWTSIRWPLLCAACGLYGVGMLPSWFFFHQVLRRLGQQPTAKCTFRAFFIGHLGKYVPGKALVVVLRSTLVAGPQVSLGAGVVAVFVETLTLLAVGATLGGVLLLMVSGNRWLVVGAVGLAVVAGVPTIPPLFRAVVARLQRKRNATLNLDQINWSLMGCGWALMLMEWTLFGASLAATLLAIPGVPTDIVLQPQTMCLIIATVSLAFVLGFVSLVPGGAGIREWVVTTALGSVVGIGTIRALVAAILLRFVWLAAELVFAGVGYLMADKGPDGR